MLRKLVPVLALIAAPAIASAQFEAGDYEVTLSGAASANRGTTSGTAAAVGTLGYFFTKEVELGVGQQVSYISPFANGSKVQGSAWGGQTEGFVEYNFDFGAWQPYVGGIAAYSYVEGATGTWFLAPVVGVKYFVNGTTFIFADVQYNYATTTPSASFWQGGLGIGFRF